MTLTYNNSEGGTPTNAVQTTDTFAGTPWATVSPGTGGTILYTTDAYYTSRTATALTSAVGFTCYMDRTLVGARQGALSMRFKMTSLPTVQGQIFVSLRATSGGSAVVALVMNSLGQVYPTDATGVEVPTTTPPPGNVVAGVWYRLEFWWTNPSVGAGTISYRVYRGDSLTPDITLDVTGTNNTTNSLSVLRVGKQTAAGSFSTLTIDDVAYDDSTTTPPALTLPSPDNYYVAQRGSASDIASGTTTAVALPTGLGIATGNYLIARIGCDNAGSGGAAPGITSITDVKSNVWTVSAPATSDPGLATEGSSIYLAWAPITHAYANNDTVTINWGTAVIAKSVVIEEWTNIDASVPVAVVATTANGAASTSVASGSITPTASGQLVYVGVALEAPAGEPFPLDTDVTDGSWFALQGLSTAAALATDNITVRGGVKRTTGTTPQQWNSTLATARDWAAVAIVFGVPTATTPLTSPVVTVSTSTSLRQATISWGSVPNAVSYLMEVQVLALAGNPANPGDWSALTPTSTFTTTGLGQTIDDSEGLDWSRTYRARTTAKVT